MYFNTPIQVVSLKQTSCACPYQLEGKTSNGDAVYVRYRSNTLTIQIGDRFELRLRLSSADSNNICSLSEVIRLTSGFIVWL